METILGIRGPDFVMVAADTTQARSIIVMKEGIGFERQTIMTLQFLFSQGVQFHFFF